MKKHLTKKLICTVLAVVLVLSTCLIACGADEQSVPATSEGSTFAYKDATYMKNDMLYVYALANEFESEAWHHWQNANIYIGYDEEDRADLGVSLEDGESKEKYFFLPTSADKEVVTILNTYSTPVTVGDTTIEAGKTAKVEYNTTSDFIVTIDGETTTLRFLKSGAEAAVYINNPDADSNGTDLLSYLREDKENDAKASGAIVSEDGTIDNTPIKKIKGRGNTTWQKEKKPFNVTYDKATSIGGIEKTKKFSFLANFQDATLTRNRFIQDLGDAVGLPYSSDSAFADLYMNGAYLGSYQITQKVDVGKNDLIKVIDDDTHLNDDGTLKDEFPFLVEIDASAGSGDYYTKSNQAGCKLTVKGPELDSDDPNYDAVLSRVQSKFDAMYTAVRTNSANMAELVDIDSLTKLMLLNELGKNWDVGVSSFYLTYQADENGSYKFFASPAWDYDNSLGNATGVVRDLKNMGVEDYEEPTGWWVKFKPGASTKKSGKYTLPGWAARNTTIMKRAAVIWFEEFVPAIETLNSKGVDYGEIFSSDVYYNYLEGSANMNYTMGWQINTGSWICDHSELILGSFDKKSGTFTADASPTTYDVNTFKGEFDYTLDWLNTRAAWLSAEFFEDYKAQAPTLPTEKLLGDSDTDGTVTIKDATLIQKHIAKLETVEGDGVLCGDVTGDENLTVQDATNIQKFLAKIEIPYPVGEPIK